VSPDVPKDATDERQETPHIPGEMANDPQETTDLQQDAT
jgi:hypothetical protein